MTIFLNSATTGFRSFVKMYGTLLSPKGTTLNCPATGISNTFGVLDVQGS